MAAISQTTFFMCIFLNENIYISIKISLKFVQNNNIPTLFQIIACCRPGDRQWPSGDIRSPSLSYSVVKSSWIMQTLGKEPTIDIFTRDISVISHWNKLENYLSKMLIKFPMATELTAVFGAGGWIHREERPEGDLSQVLLASARTIQTASMHVVFHWCWWEIFCIAPCLYIVIGTFILRIMSYVSIVNVQY